MEYKQFEILKKYSNLIDHGITTRGLDFMHVDYNSSIFIESKNKLSQEFNIDNKNTFFINQVHGKEIRIIDDTSSNEILDYDGLITNCSGKLLCTCFADCVPVLLFDPAKKVIASIHAGWRGTEKEIVKNAVRIMKNKFFCEEKDIIACIGPSIGSCCFEVNNEVFEVFSKYKEVTKCENGKFFVDLKKVNKIQLVEERILPSNIEIMNICTACKNHIFYSYRKGDKTCGRFCAFIALK